MAEKGYSNWSPWKSVDGNYNKMHINNKDDKITNTIFHFIFQVKVSF